MSELASKFGDAESQSKRDRSESGDQAPSGKRGAVDRDCDLGSSPAHFNRRWKEYLDKALDELQERIVSSISRDIHEFNESIQSRLCAMDERISHLERHVEEKDVEIVKLKAELCQTKDEIRRLSERAESAEMNSRIPCLILSGRALAARQGQPPSPGDATAAPDALLLAVRVAAAWAPGPCCRCARGCAVSLRRSGLCPPPSQPAGSCRRHRYRG